MSRRRKLEKFAKILAYDHVYEMTKIGSSLVRHHAEETIEIKGQWRPKAYANEQSLIVELACGRGEYSVGLAQMHPHINYLGVDIKGARIYQGAKRALELGLPNVAFLRTRIEQLDLYFSTGEIDAIWITFPDPFVAKPNRRLTSPRFLDMYYNLLADGALIHLKTDDDDLFFYSAEEGQKHTKYRLIEQCENISEMRKSVPELNISTYYERQHLAAKKR